MGTKLQILAMDQTRPVLICDQCKAVADSLSNGEARVGDILISKEALMRMLNLQDAKCLSFWVDTSRDMLVIRTIQTGPKPGLWFQEVNLAIRPEGAEYPQHLIGDV